MISRGRFPTADSLACLAGVVVSTRQPGRTKAVSFRWGADRQLRDAICDFAGDRVKANPWANDLYQRARGHDRHMPSESWPAPGSHRALQHALNQEQAGVA